MKEGARQLTWGRDMSATVLSAFYDMDMLYKVNFSLFFLRALRVKL